MCSALRWVCIGPILPVPRLSVPRHRRWNLCAECRSEEHTSELQSRQYFVCRLLLEKNRARIVLITPGFDSKNNPPARHIKRAFQLGIDTNHIAGNTVVFAIFF